MKWDCFRKPRRFIDTECYPHGKGVATRKSCIHGLGVAVWVRIYDFRTALERRLVGAGERTQWEGACPSCRGPELRF